VHAAAVVCGCETAGPGVQQNNRSRSREKTHGPERGAGGLRCVRATGATEIAMCRTIKADRIANSFNPTMLRRALFEGTPAGGSTAAEAQAGPRFWGDTQAHPPFLQKGNRT
jgi:hypothetical protein